MNEHCQWPAHVARRMADHIHTEVKGMVSTSRLVRRAEGIALVHRHDLQVGKLLGRGAFSEVHSVRIVGGDQRDPNTKRPVEFAMKHLKPKLMSQPDNFRLAAAELAVEAHMLASLDHPNILKIRGWAANGVASFTSGRHDGFFLLLDKLDETLDQRIINWQRLRAVQEAQAAQNNGSLVTDLWRRFAQPEDNTSVLLQERQELVLEKQRQHLYLEKLSVCADLCSALAYLHERGIIFRDLKPNNIGFLNGRVQLFDFGLSRELPSANLTEPFEMSGKVGTLRYMAVEVACHARYNVSADVYSWAMVSYEALTLEKPFCGWTRDMHANLVCGRGVRPETKTLSGRVRGLLEAAWNQTADARPTMLQACDQMRHLVDDQLIVAAALQRDAPSSTEMVMELPTDFCVRKAPDRYHSALSEAFTRSTMSSAMSSSADSFMDL